MPNDPLVAELLANRDALIAEATAAKGDAFAGQLAALLDRVKGGDSKALTSLQQLMAQHSSSLELLSRLMKKINDARNSIIDRMR